MPPYTVNFNYEPEEIKSNIENSETMNTIFHYYLDFSPSMQGFFQEDINSNMRAVINAFREINKLGNKKEFFCCTDKIEAVDEENLYKNMESSLRIREYYDAIISDNGIGTEEEQNQNLQDVINNINLADIFGPQYREYEGYKTGEESLNIIITDLNFKKNINDTEGQSTLIGEFAQYLGLVCAESNIAIYHIDSNFAGITSDEYELGAEYKSAIELQSFFIIVESQNDTAYGNFIEKLESMLMQQRVDCSRKYELVNKVSNKEKELDIDLDFIRKKEWIEITNFNYNKNSFSGLQDNAIGLGIVQRHGVSSLNMHTSLIEIIGCNNTKEITTGDVQIDVRTKVSYPKGKKKFKRIEGKNIIFSIGNYIKGGDKFEELETDMISSIKCGTIWEEEEMYLTLELEMNSNIVQTEMEKAYEDSFFQRNKLLQKRYFVIELQCFLEKPDYSLPKWALDNEDIQDKIEVYNRIIESKEVAFSNLSEERRYMGSILLYITY